MLEILHALCFLGICRWSPGVRELETPRFTDTVKVPPGMWWGAPRLPSGCCKEYVTMQTLREIHQIPIMGAENSELNRDTEAWKLLSN